MVSTWNVLTSWLPTSNLSKYLGAPVANQVHFAYLRCKSTDDSETDEIYVKWSGQRIWGPVSVSAGNAINLDHFVLLQGDSDVVEIFDEDWPSDDHLGAHLISKLELGGGWRTAIFRNEDAEYELDYEVFSN